MFWVKLEYKDKRKKTTWLIFFDCMSMTIAIANDKHINNDKKIILALKNRFACDRL